MSQTERLLFCVTRISDGWVVLEYGDFKHRKELTHHTTWESVEAKLRKIAFPFPDKTEPRLP